jgi:HK97 family phage prohead protease
MINKNFNVSVGISTKDITVSEDKQYLDIEGYASRMTINGRKVVDLDGEHIETSGFDLVAKRLLMNHNIHEPVGDLVLTHTHDGVKIKARVYRKAMEEKEFERVKLGLYDFSVGFFATEVDYKDIEGKKIRCFTKGTIYETSLVAIPANPSATLDSIKSKVTDGELPTKRELEKVLRDGCGFSKRQASAIASQYEPEIKKEVKPDFGDVKEMLNNLLNS